MPNQKGFLKIAIIIIALILIGGGYFVFNEKDRDISIQDAENQNSQLNQSSASSGNDNVSTEINPKDYSLEEYPVQQSPIYSQIEKSCFTRGSESEYFKKSAQFIEKMKDIRLVKNKNEIIIPSWVQFIISNNNQKLSCDNYWNSNSTEVFSTPINGKYLYLIGFNSGDDQGRKTIYRLDLSSLEVKKLSSPENIPNYSYLDYKILPDGKRLIKWNKGNEISKSNLYFVNLEKDSIDLLYSAPQDQWFVSSIIGNPGTDEYPSYDIKIEGGQVIVGLYYKNSMTQKGTDDCGYDGCDYINSYEFINRVTIPIPDN
ncbi:TPA: hypothetical protein DEW47_00300 [Patescibacteria group bacterium]|nr:MAG: hypothetical protein UT71_C0010G0024 [Parcubacteria group bacterium GW2011_GWF2_40_10]KKR47068.1 MAG: hypothetical protein UT83_C0014G0019 [Parcubacteria group bacterium GW2011_GWA2_40_143]KKR59747.1 MAG: hypothetical protein UT97_C0012G0035 [Parcubacteria group bacterium GW2011_GWC2_40_31]HCI04414.1 hypothetical protein [Patescibacteria group bacterium]